MVRDDTDAKYVVFTSPCGDAAKSACAERRAAYLRGGGSGVRRGAAGGREASPVGVGRGRGRAAVGCAQSVLEVVAGLVGVVDDGLADDRQRDARELAQRLLVLRHVAPAEKLVALRFDLILEQLLSR